MSRLLFNFAGNEDGKADRDDYNFEVAHNALKAGLAAALAAAAGTPTPSSIRTQCTDTADRRT